MSKFQDTKAKLQRGGFTLVELLVAIALFAIIVTVATAGFVNALRTQRQVASLISSESNISLVIEQIAREERTGYLFCHAYGSTQILPSCGCAADPQIAGAYTCSALDYYTADSSHVHYSLSGGQLLKSDSNASTTSAQAITGGGVTVKYLDFIVFGNFEGDHWTPRVTMDIGITPSSTDPAVNQDVIRLQTTVSARQIDCDTSNPSSTKC